MDGLYTALSAAQFFEGLIAKCLDIEFVPQVCFSSVPPLLLEAVNATEVSSKVLIDTALMV
jgi:hypothetical protein